VDTFVLEKSTTAKIYSHVIGLDAVRASHQIDKALRDVYLSRRQRKKPVVTGLEL
jgi:hypothetical protein